MPLYVVLSNFTEQGRTDIVTTQTLRGFTVEEFRRVTEGITPAT